MSKAKRKTSKAKTPLTPLFKAKPAASTPTKVSSWVEREEERAAQHMRSIR